MQLADNLDFLMIGEGIERPASVKECSVDFSAAATTKLVKKIDRTGFREWSRPGIRAQLLDARTRKLVMDFVVEGDQSSTHILNAVSPAFTCSFPFAKMVADRIPKPQ